MKNILFNFMAVLLLLTACKKTEDTGRVKFARITFANATEYGSNPLVMFGGKKYATDGLPIVTDLGDKRFQVFKASGEEVLDTVLNITGSQLYHVYQLDSTIAPVLVTEIPEPPGEPGNPLNGEAGAPEGFMKIKIAYKPQFIFLEGIDIVLHSPDKKGNIVPIATFTHVNAAYNEDFYVVKRPEIFDGSLSVVYRITYQNSITKEQIINKSGNVYTSDIAETLPLGKKNLFMIDVTDGKPSSRWYPGAIFIDEVHYSLIPKVLWQRP
ncbi:hypothetical protein ACSBL2_08600 [Pedobacter sp. AW31-3R]|uniref:hypothetical protein n=1 Tax=Pedobacter sp. AW31-3R TaxID=3445781 RepID=UPI003F9F579B